VPNKYTEKSPNAIFSRDEIELCVNPLFPPGTMLLGNVAMYNVEEQSPPWVAEFAELGILADVLKALSTHEIRFFDHGDKLIHYDAFGIEHEIELHPLPSGRRWALIPKGG
jgi:hypothetical protein